MTRPKSDPQHAIRWKAAFWAGLCCLGLFLALRTVAPSLAAAPAQESLQPAAGPTPVARSESPGPGRQNTLRWLYDSLGWFYVSVFLGISFALVALTVMNALALRRESIVPAHLVAGLAAHLDDQCFQEAYQLAKNDDSFLGHVLAAGMAKAAGGQDAAIQAMQEVGDEGHLKLQHQVGYLALIAQIGPLVGLLCSVEGMIEAFAAIASKNVAPKPWELAQGIGLALVATLIGLWIAIPAIALHHWFRCRLSRLMLEAATTAENLMTRLRGGK
jgi:biopolymer transport protein ExbB